MEFTTLMLKVPNLTDEDMLFHFMDGLQNWSKTKLEYTQVSTIDEATTQVEALMDFKHEKHDKINGKEARGGHAKGGGYSGRNKENNHTLTVMIRLSARSSSASATLRRKSNPRREATTTYVGVLTAMKGDPK